MFPPVKWDKHTYLLLVRLPPCKVGLHQMSSSLSLLSLRSQPRCGVSESPGRILGPPHEPLAGVGLGFSTLGEYWGHVGNQHLWSTDCMPALQPNASALTQATSAPESLGQPWWGGRGQEVKERHSH